MSEPVPPGRAVRAVRRISAVVGAVEITIGVITLVMILVFVFLQALQRYLPIPQIAWTGELARFAMVWLTFAVMGLLVTLRGHIALEIVDAINRPMLVRVVQTFALLVVAAVGAGIVVEAIALISTQGIIKSPVLRLPMSWVYVPILFGAISTVLRSAVGAVDIALHGPILAEVTDGIPEVTDATVRSGDPRAEGSSL